MYFYIIYNYEGIILMALVSLSVYKDFVLKRLTAVFWCLAWNNFLMPRLQIRA